MLLLNPCRTEIINAHLFAPHHCNSPINVVPCYSNSPPHSCALSRSDSPSHHSCAPSRSDSPSHHSCGRQVHLKQVAVTCALLGFDPDGRGTAVVQVRGGAGRCREWRRGGGVARGGAGRGEGGGDPGAWRSCAGQCGTKRGGGIPLSHS